MGMEGLMQVIGNYYNTAYAGARKQVLAEEQDQLANALQAAGAQGIAGSGAYQKGIAASLRKNSQNALAGISGNLAQNQAGMVAQGSISSMLADQNFQNQMALINNQRAYEEEQARKAIPGNIAGMIFSPLMGAYTGGVGKGLGYNIANALGGPNMWSNMGGGYNADIETENMLLNEGLPYIKP